MKTSSIPFVNLLADPSSLVRRQAITSIMRRRKERWLAVTDLLPLLNDPEDQVRRAAIKALGTLRDQRALRGFRMLLADQQQTLQFISLQRRIFKGL